MPVQEKYTLKEQKSIAQEAQDTKDVGGVAVKYELHPSTVYRYINVHIKKTGKEKLINFRVEEEQYKILLDKAKKLGYEEDLSSYLRKILFGKFLANDNPRELVKELYQARGEINKIGSNINQIANYTNFLQSQGYIEDDISKDLTTQLNDMAKTLKEHRELIDQTIRKI